MLVGGVVYYKVYTRCQYRMTTKTIKLGTPGHSPALKFELELQELEGGGAPTLSRISKCFQVFDEIIPHLGAYQRVMQLVKQELYMAVYSGDWTSGGRTQHQAVSKAGAKNNLTPLPFFVIAQRLTEKKAGERSKFKTEISSLKEQLYTCEADLEKAMSSLDAYRHDLKDRDVKLHHLTSELRTHCAEKERLQEIISNNQHSKERLCQELDFRMFSLRTAITSLKEENGRLRVFKLTHDQLQQTPLLTAKDELSLGPANSKNEMEQHIASNKKLKFQLLSLQNSLMDELDSWLQTCYSNKSLVLPAEMIHKKKTFKQKISALSAEVCLLDKHQQALCERLEQLESLKNTSAHTALVLPFHPLNPLIPQEQVSNKYAVMIHTSSDGGKNFYPLKVAQHCSSCTQKTVVCPHKICEDDLVIQIPVNSSHIQISRPSLHLVQPKAHSAQPIPRIKDVSTPIKQGLHNAVPDFGYLWIQFKNKFSDFELMVSKKISEVQLLELVEQFYATLLLQDDRAVLLISDDDDDDHTPSLPESLFEFMRQHYIVKSLAPVSCYAFIAALEEYYPEKKELLVVSHALCGELDGCGFRYILLQADLVQVLTWTSQSQFSAFMSSLYPFLGEEDVEQLGLNYIAHSDNRLSALLVLEFLQFLLLAHKDPLVIMLESKLAELPCRTMGCMLETEFAEAMEKLVPSSSDLLCHRLFLQSLSLFQEKSNCSRQTLPTRNLAYIASYLHRLNTQDQLKVELMRLKASMEIMDDKKHKTEESGTVLMHSMETVRDLMERLKTLS